MKSEHINIVLNMSTNTFRKTKTYPWLAVVVRLPRCLCLLLVAQFAKNINMNFFYHERYENIKQPHVSSFFAKLDLGSLKLQHV